MNDAKVYPPFDELEVGNLVIIDNWVGQISDMAETRMGVSMIQVTSAKAVAFGQRPEWIVWVPDRIETVTMGDRVYSLFMMRVDIMDDRYKNLHELWDKWKDEKTE